MSNYDAILILGGGVHECGKLPLWVEARLQRALDLEQGEPIITLSVGTTHKPPPLDEHGFPIFESVAAASYLADHGIAPERILVEATSYDTIGNAYFSRVIHVDPAGFRRLLIITSAFHMPRTEAVFRWVYGLDAPARGYELHFEVTPDAGVSVEALEARREKERASLERLRPAMARITTLQELHRWLFGEHGAYAVGVGPERETGRRRDLY